MATIFRVRKNNNNNNNAGSGGKIMRGRRVVDVRSPYARPPAPAPAENPNRLLGLISPATKMITGAAKMISTIFFPDTPPTSSSSEDDSDNGDYDDDVSSQGEDRLNQNRAIQEANKYAEKLQFTVQKNEIKLAIEHLIMQETFSREECNKLVKSIVSRVVESPTLHGASQSDWPARKLTSAFSYSVNAFDSPCPRAPAVGGNVPDICNTAVMEAKKWVEEKKTESYLQIHKSQGTFTPNPCMLSNVTEGELGSPVLMAKSYMKSRPPWASPSVGQSEFRTSPNGRYFSEEGIPYSVGTHALSSSKDLKRSTIATDSWNALDGSRRVRFKSAEDTVQPLSSHSNSQKDGHEALSTNPAILNSDHNQDLEGAQITVDKGTTHVPEDPETHDVLGSPDQSAVVVNSQLRCTPSEGFKPAMQSDSNDLPGANGTDEFSIQPEGEQVMEPSQRHQCFGLKETDSFADSQAQKDNAKQKEINGCSDRDVANGFSPASSLSARVNAESSAIPSNGGGRNLISSSDGKWEGSCELLSEASVEVPISDKINNITSAPLDSSSSQSKELLHTETQSVLSPGMKKRSSTRVEKQVVKKAGKYNRRGRGRGK